MAIKKSFFFFLVLVLCSNIVPSEASEAASYHTSKTVQWLTSYEEAITQAKAKARPILLFFTGSDWCTWCNKLEEEVFDTPEFAQALADKLIFVKIDFPLSSSLDETLTQQNAALQEKYGVRSFPTLILLDEEEIQMGVTGYRTGGGKKYATHLQRMVNEYIAYKRKMDNLGKGKLSAAELKKLYEKADELNNIEDMQKIVKVGLESEEELFFLTEYYRFLVEEGQIHDEKTIAIREKLLAADPLNSKHTHYHAAVIDFQAYAHEMEREGYSPELAVAPLVQYIERFGKQEKDHLWRLQMLISQVFLSQSEREKALLYAHDAYAAAPPSVKPKISQAIKGMQIAD